MPIDLVGNLKTFHFRNLHPQVFIGTASDRYAGWIGQIYSEDRYAGRITKRTKIVGGNTFVEEVLPVDSVEEYFTHFPVLEIDFTFYRLLLEENGQPTQNYRVLENYRRHLKTGDRLILKVPQIITAQKIHRGDQFLQNEAFLSAKIFDEQFYKPAVNLLGQNLTGFIFEQEYQSKEDRTPVNEMARELDRFFRAIPKAGGLDAAPGNGRYIMAVPAGLAMPKINEEKVLITGSYLYVLALRIPIVHPGCSPFLLSQAIEIILPTMASEDM